MCQNNAKFSTLKIDFQKCTKLQFKSFAMVLLSFKTRLEAYLYTEGHLQNTIFHLLPT